MNFIDQSQWLFTDEELTRTPSCLDGLPLPTEHASRSKAVNFILQVGLILKLPQNTLFTASIYMHRFFMRYSMKDIPGRPGMHPYAVAATALFLATKVDENCRKMKEYVIACCRVGLKNPNLIVDEQSKEFWRWRDTILHNEDLLLEALCFDLQLELPHRFLWDFMAHFRLRDNKNLRNAAWAFLNDSMYTVLCLQFPARTIAAAALYAAARHVGVRLPDDADTGAPWWEQLQLHLADLRTVCNRLADVYEGLTFPNPNAKNSHYYERMPVGLAQVDEASDPTRSLGFLPQTPPPAMPLGVGVGASVSPELNGGRKREREREESAGLGDVAKRQRVEDGGQSRVPSRPAPAMLGIILTPLL
ncbi:hypothetical protein KEM55_000538 [Ascosphaera atra]|nr:hypothetical protein KEM55_000538 [Ascosphaera atra]